MLCRKYSPLKDDKCISGLGQHLCKVKCPRSSFGVQRPLIKFKAFFEGFVIPKYDIVPLVPVAHQTI